MHKIVQLVIESKIKPIILSKVGGTSILKSVQSIANAKISSYSEMLEQIVFSGENESVDAAINAFVGIIVKHHLCITQET